MSDKNATEVVKADRAGIAQAAQVLEAGGLVAVPTETVYGLAARADSAEAVARIYAAKGRPDFNPLIVHVRDAEQAARYALFMGAAREMARHYWPGPLTMVLPLKDEAALTPAVTAGLPTVALRSPDRASLRALLSSVDFPLAAPSANRSGFVSPTRVEHVLSTLDGKVDLVLDDGEPCTQGIESTIVAVREHGSLEELRPGPIGLTGIAQELGLQIAAPRKSDTSIEAPGQLASHYAPGKPVRLGASEAEDDEFLIGFGEVAGDCSLSASGDLYEAAARLYDCLHKGAASPKTRIAVAAVPDDEIGRAINDRLRRAAAPTA